MSKVSLKEEASELIGDKYGVSIYFKEDKSLSISCKTSVEVEDVLNKLSSLNWYRTKESDIEIMIQTCNILYVRVNEYLSVENDEEDDFIEQGENNGFW